MMKLRSATPASDLSFIGRMLIVVAVVTMAVAVPVQMFSARPASADEYDARIQALRQKIGNYQNEANALREKANTLQNTLNQLAADKAAIQLEVDLYQTQYDQLVKDIAATQKRIEENRKVSGDLIVRSSLSDDVPLIVRLAASENLADYIDGEASRISVRDTIVQKTEESNRLKKELVVKQAKVKVVLEEQKLKRDELASKEAQQADILAKTRGDEAEYQKMIKDSEGQIAGFRKMQEELQRLRQQGVGGGKYITVGGSGGYPWANVGYPCWSAGCGDPWQLYYRECVSYVAWRLSNQGYGVTGFSGQGHAYQWPSTTYNWRYLANPIIVNQSSSPAKGNAAVFPAGVNGAAWTGHVMYVEEVYGNGAILVSEYNWDGRGTYSQRELQPHEYNGTIFLTFPRR